MVSVMRFAASWRPQEAHQSISPSMLKSGEFGQFRGITARPRSGYIYTRLNPGPSTACSLFPASPCGDIPIDRARRSRMLAIRSAISPVRHPRYRSPGSSAPALCPRTKVGCSPVPFPSSERAPPLVQKFAFIRPPDLSGCSRPGPPSRGCPRADLEPAHERTLHRLTSAPCTGSLASCGC